MVRTYAQPPGRNIIRRASVMTVELERLEAKFATAGEASTDDLNLYFRGAGNLRRLLEAIGLKRRPRDVSSPSLSEIAREIADLRDYTESIESTTDSDSTEGVA